MKGQNQAVALILLIGITVAGVAALSEQVFGLLNSQSAEEAVPDANPGEIRVQSCWSNTTHAKFSMRNGQEQKLNTSRLSILVNGSLMNHESSQEIVDGQKTFRISIRQLLRGKKIVDNSVFKIVSGNGKEDTLFCEDLEAPRPLALNSSLSRPQDPDNDGLYEDVDGDGDTDHIGDVEGSGASDPEHLEYHINNDNANPAFFDFNNDRTMDIIDVNTLNSENS